MPSPEVAHNTLTALRRLVVVFVIAAALLFVYSVWQSYSGRVALRRAQVAGCERGKKDRAANALGWRVAEQSRRREGKRQLADLYAHIAQGLEQRSRINCEDVYPPVSLRP